MREDQFIETWAIVINRQTYRLTGNQAEIVKQAIENNNRGIILFDEFSISLPYIQEFYLESREPNPKYIIGPPDMDIDLTPEQLEFNRKKIREIKEKLKNK